MVIDSTIFPEVALVVATLVLVYVTYTLKRATDHLARVQILPKLVLANTYYSDAEGNPLILIVENKGQGAAFKTRVSGITPQGVKLAVEQSIGLVGRPLRNQTISPADSTSFLITGAAAGQPLGIEIQYEDAEGHSYKESLQIRTPAK